jgi:hypothetical protein
MRRDRRCVRRSSSRWHPVDTGDVQEALDARDSSRGQRRGGSAGAVALGRDQVGHVALIEAVAQSPRTLRARSRGTYRALT